MPIKKPQLVFDEAQGTVVVLQHYVAYALVGGEHRYVRVRSTLDVGGTATDATATREARSIARKAAAKVVGY